MNKEINGIKYFLCSVLLLISLAACSGPTKATSESVTDASKEKTTQLTEEERNILDNGYKVGEYTFYLTKKQKENLDSRNEILSRLKEIPERYEIQKEQINTNKRLNIVPHGMVYDPDKEKYNLSCFLINTSGENIQSFSMYLKPVFKGVKYEEWAELKGDNNNIGKIPDKSMFTIDVTGNIPKENYAELSKNTTKDVEFEIKDLEINGKKVENTKEN